MRKAYLLLIAAILLSSCTKEIHVRVGKVHKIVTVGTRPEPVVGAAEPVSAVVPSADYRYDAPPSVSRETYIQGWCSPPMAGWSSSPACDEAGEMYDILVDAGLDPAVEFGQAAHETVLGTAGVGVVAIKNLHGVQCHTGDNRIGDASVPWGNGCAGRYASYAAAVETWARLINREYVGVGLNTPDLAVQKYAPVGYDGNDPPSYIAQMKGYVDALRGREPDQYTTMEFRAEASYSLSYVLQGDVGVNVRAALNANNGAIREFVINPGETWSFGHSIAPISAMGYLPKVYSPPTGQWVEAGGWCDVSSMYLNVALDLGLKADYPQHSGVSTPFPGIWLNEDGSGQDLKITNTKDRPVVFRAVEENGELVVYGGFV